MSTNPNANPYAPPKAEVIDAVEEHVVAPASRGARLGASLLDGLVSLVVALPLLIGLIPAFLNSRGNPNALPGAMGAAMMGGAALLTALLAIAWIVVTFIFVKRYSQTIGKRMVGIKVVRSNGSHASLGRIFWLRNVVNMLPSAIPLVGSFYGLVDVLFIFGGKRQCIHDLIADTIVVNA